MLSALAGKATCASSAPTSCPTASRPASTTPRVTATTPATRLTRAVRASKHDRGHDAQLAARIHHAVLQTWPTNDVDAVVTLPPKPGAHDCAAGLRELVADALDIADAGPALAQAFDVSGYRRMTIAERRASTPGRFVITSRVSGLRLLLSDDIVTSGVQAQQGRPRAPTGRRRKRPVRRGRADHRHVNPRLTSVRPST